MSSSGVREEDIFSQGATADGLRDAVFMVATRASDHLITARSMVNNMKKDEDMGHVFEHIDDEGHQYSSQQRQAATSIDKQMEEYARGYGVIMGPAISTQLWLDRLQKVDFNIFHDSLRRPQWKLPLVAWWMNRRKHLWPCNDPAWSKHQGCFCDSLRSSWHLPSFRELPQWRQSEHCDHTASLSRWGAFDRRVWCIQYPKRWDAPGLPPECLHPIGEWRVWRIDDRGLPFQKHECPS